MKSRSQVRWLVWVVLSIAISGCVPVPIIVPAWHTGRRSYDASDIAKLQPGRSTLEDVLFAFGEPDGVATDESWTVYATNEYQGAAGILIIGHVAGAVGQDTQRTTRYILSFDNAGMLTAVEHQERTCTQLGDLERTPPCLDASGRDLPPGAGDSAKMPLYIPADSPEVRGDKSCVLPTPGGGSTQGLVQRGEAARGDDGITYWCNEGVWIR